jgi:hypothetical protein
MMRSYVAVGVLTLLLLATVPVGAAPSLQKGAQTSYKLSASISLFQSCETLGLSTSSNIIVCPTIATLPSTVDINGTLGWTVTDLNTTTASLRVARDLVVSNGDTSTLIAHASGGFNESINLATRITSLLPLLMPSIDQALQMAQTSLTNSLPTGVNLSASMLILQDTLMHEPVYTMWWVNGPLKLNQTVPVLVLPTNVTGTSSVDLGATLGTRTAWTLAFSFSWPLIPLGPATTSPSSIPLGNNLELAFRFNYDQTSDLLLSTSASIHLGFGEETTTQPNPCLSSPSSTSCPVRSNPTTIMREFGINVQASLKLASTTLDLSHQTTQTSLSQNGNTGSQSGTDSGTGSGSSPGTGTGRDSSSGTGGTTDGTGQPTSNQGQPRSSLPSGWLPLIYGILGTAAAAIVGASISITRRRLKRAASNESTIPPSV